MFTSLHGHSIIVMLLLKQSEAKQKCIAENWDLTSPTRKEVTQRGSSLNVQQLVEKAVGYWKSFSPNQLDKRDNSEKHV